MRGTVVRRPATAARRVRLVETGVTARDPQRRRRDFVNPPYGRVHTLWSSERLRSSRVRRHGEPSSGVHQPAPGGRGLSGRYLVGRRVAGLAARRRRFLPGLGPGRPRRCRGDGVDRPGHPAPAGAPPVGRGRRVAAWPGHPGDVRGPAPVGPTRPGGRRRLHRRACPGFPSCPWSRTSRPPVVAAPPPRRRSSPPSGVAARLRPRRPPRPDGVARRSRLRSRREGDAALPRTPPPRLPRQRRRCPGPPGATALPVRSTPASCLRSRRRPPGSGRARAVPGRVDRSRRHGGGTADPSDAAERPHAVPSSPPGRFAQRLRPCDRRRSAGSVGPSRRRRRQVPERCRRARFGGLVSTPLPGGVCGFRSLVTSSPARRRGVSCDSLGSDVLPGDGSVWAEHADSRIACTSCVSRPRVPLHLVVTEL